MSKYPRASFLKSADSPAAFGDESGSEVAFAGRSNSGKSSAINALTQRHALARTSKTPGQTQLINFFEAWGPADEATVEGRKRLSTILFS